MASFVVYFWGPAGLAHSKISGDIFQNFSGPLTDDSVTLSGKLVFSKQPPLLPKILEALSRRNDPSLPSTADKPHARRY